MEDHHSASSGNVGATTLFCCFCAAPWFSLFLIALSVMFLAYDPHPSKEDKNSGIIATALFWSGVFFLLVSVGCSIRIYLRMIIPADEPTAVCCDFTKIPAAIAGSSRKGFPLLVDDSGDNAPGLEFVAVGAKLCDWIYDPEPLTTMVFNDLPFDVHILLTVDGATDTRVYLYAGGKHKFDSSALRKNGEGHARNITMRISRVVPVQAFKGRCILTTNDFSPYYSYHLISDESDRNCQFSLVPRSALPEALRKVHIEYSHKHNRRGDENEADEIGGVVQWALVAPKASSQTEEPEYKQDNDVSAIDIESATPEESGGGEENIIYLVFRGSTNLADVSVNFGGTPLFVSELGLRVHGGMWCALHSHKTSILDHVLSIMESQGRSRRLVICGHSLGGGYALLIALELMLKGIQPSAVVTFGCPMVIVPDPESRIWTSLQKISLLVVNSWDIIPRMPSFESWLFRVLPHPQVSCKYGATSFSLKMRAHFCGCVIIGHAFAQVMGILASSTVLIEQHIRPVWSTIAVYDACGYILFLDITNPGHAMCVIADGDVKGGKHREILGTTPDIPGSFVLAQHRMGRYIEVCDHLAQSIKVKNSVETQG